MDKNLYFHEIVPFIRYAQIIKIQSESQFISLKSYDYRFFYCLEGNGEIHLGNNVFLMHRGSLAIWQPGLKYHLYSNNEDYIKMLGFNFDFTQNFRFKNTPTPPSKSNDFKNKDIIEKINFIDINIFNNPVHLKNMHEIESILHEIIKEQKSKKKFYENKSSGLFSLVLCEIARIASFSSENEKSHNIINSVINYIHRNYNKSLTNKHLGKIFNYHPNYINKLMILHTGISLHKYILNYRISKALNFIQTTDLSIKEISRKVGFNDFTHFSKYFKKTIGSSPSQFRHHNY